MRWEVDDHREAATRSVLGPDLTAHRLGQATSDSEPEAHTTACGHVPKPLERCEEELLASSGIRARCRRP